jgi:RNA polymerase sigma factor (sigma-70 family)
MRSTSKSTIDFWMDNAARYPLLKPAQVLEISRRIQELDEDSPIRKKFVNKLVRHNLRLVVNAVRAFMNTSHKKWGDPETVDYLQVGALGLVAAAEKFDPTRGYAFSTYANQWIRSKVSRYNMKTITPVYVSESIGRQVVFYKRNGYMKTKFNQRKMSDQETRRVLELASLAYNYVALDKPMESGTPMIDQIASPINDSETLTFGQSIDEAMNAAGISLTGREVLVRSCIQNETTNQIAERMGLTINQVKREKRKALQSARANQEQFCAGIM